MRYHDINSYTLFNNTKQCSYIKFNYLPHHEENLFLSPVAFLKTSMILDMMPCYLEGHQHFGGYLFYLQG